MSRRQRKTQGVPVLKLPPARLNDVVLALRGHEYDRAGFRDAVLDVFAGTKEMGEKSVFRGMAIPTLRALGLLLGFETELRLSSDGALVAAGAEAGSQRPLAAVLRTVERALGLDDIWKKRTPMREAVSALLAREANTPESLRRVQRWLAYLAYAAVTVEHEGVYVRKPESAVALSAKEFVRRLLVAYRRLRPKTVGEPAVDIDEISREVVVTIFKEREETLTRARFDEYLTETIVSKAGFVHLHRSMGAGQKLFHLRGEAFESLSIRED